jgi:hypothetical protein
MGNEKAALIEDNKKFGKDKPSSSKASGKESSELLSAG